jgi:nucleoside-diphosphate-sugar epimerase
MMRVLITGASGFIGRHCLRRLLNESCEIHAVNRAGRGENNSRVHWHAADLRDPTQTKELVSAVRPTHLLHGAWVATPRVYGHSPDNVAWMQAGVALAWAFGEYGGSRFVGIGSSAEYDANDAPCVEDETPVRPATIYGKCKAACWLGVQAVAQHHGFSTAWGRIFLPYGPGDPAQRLIPMVLEALVAGKPVETTHGNQVRDFIFVADAADLLVQLLLSMEGGAFNVGTGHGSAIRWVIESLAAKYNGNHLLRFGALKPTASEPSVLVADMNKVATRIGWRALTGIESGLDRTLEEKGAR